MAKIHGQFKVNGLFPTGLEIPGCWMRNRAVVRFRCKDEVREIKIRGTFHANSADLHSRFNRRAPTVRLALDHKVSQVFAPAADGDFEWVLSTGGCCCHPTEPYELQLHLGGVVVSNFLAMLGRKFQKASWLPLGIRHWLQPFRRQHNNRQLLIRSIGVNGRPLLDLERAHSAFDADFLFHHSDIGLNVIGWFHGFLGVGESARACAKAAQAVQLEVDAINLELHLEGGQSDTLWSGPLREQGKQSITIAHVDAPQSFDLVNKHSVELNKDRYRIGYWAWELPEFPDAWIRYASVFDEIWCPSEFCRQAMAAKLPVPVITMPHAIEVIPAKGTVPEWRKRFQLPEDKFLFLFSFDLNSYAPRKNPEAVIDAYRKAFTGGSTSEAQQVGLVLKMHGRGYRNEEREQLERLRRELPNLYLVDETLSREELTGLQMACDCFVSLHRSEGFGLAVAEMMALGKPVISTDWSATAEFVQAETGCPVACRLKALDHNVGPYTKGQVWADADTDDAASWMRRIVSDKPFRDRIALAGQRCILEHYSPEAIGKRYRRRLKSIALFR